MPIHLNKYQNTVLYLCSKLGGEIRGKKKLAKLLYFADFDYYEKYNKSITGDVYRAKPMGPFPIELENITNGMADDNLISISQIEREGYNPTEVYTAVSLPEDNALTDDEKKMLDRVAIRYGHLSGTQLQELSHAEAPYIGTELEDQIPYELTFYRGTDFSDL